MEDYSARAHIPFIIKQKFMTINYRNCRKLILALLLFLSVKNSKAQTTYWWNDAVFYEAFVRSFYDTNGDGVGDLQGLTDKLDYLDELGVNAIWLMPVCASPSYHGYDITNYKSVQPAYGTKQQYIDFVDSAHKHGIKVIFDFVMNHSSSSHPWFQAATQNDPFYHDFYVWSPTNPGTMSPWGTATWHFYNASLGYYYGIFWSGMPDLNYNTQAVHDSMFSIAEFWLDSMHVDGFRLDAATYLYEDGNQILNCPATYQFWHDFHTFYKGINDSAMTVGEVWWPTDTILPYVLGGDKLDFCFEFDLASDIISAINSGNPSQLKIEAQYAYDQFPYLQYGTFLTNHDQDRVIDKFSGSISKMKAAAAIYLTLPGVPFVYYGEEIGMKGSGADENKRRPMQWTSGAHAGFTTGNPWEALNNNYTTYNVATEEADSNSLLNWYKKLIAIRNEEPALRRGNYIATAGAPSSIYSFVREYDGDTILVVINTSNQTFSDFTVSMNGTGVKPGDIVFTDLLYPQNPFLLHEDASYNLGTLEIGPYGVLIYRLDEFLGINEALYSAPIKIFPNPVSNYVTIPLRKNVINPISISIANAEGRIFQRSQMNVNDSRLIIDVRNFNDGIYFLEIKDGEEIQNLKFTVVK